MKMSRLIFMVVERRCYNCWCLFSVLANVAYLFQALTLSNQRACLTKRGCSLSEPRTPPAGIPCLPFLSCFLASSSLPAHSPLPTSKLGQRNVEAQSSLQPRLKGEIKAEVTHAVAACSLVTHFPGCIRELLRRSLPAVFSVVTEHL